MRALVRPPGPRLADGIVTHLARQPVDVDLANLQWRAYVDALEANGWSTIHVPGVDDCPDAVFIEDTAVVYRDLAVVTRPGADSRKPEVLATAAVVAELGYDVQHLKAPATLDGGDVLKVGDTIYVGRGGRTNAEGVRQLRHHLESRGATVVPVPVSRVLHLKSAVTALPDGSIVGYPPQVDDPGLFAHFRAVPEESGAHVVLLSDDRLLVAADCPLSVELYAGLGYDCVVVDISEFQKLEACVTCLSIRLRDPDVAARSPSADG
jgi:dimethylargininase